MRELSQLVSELSNSYDKISVIQKKLYHEVNEYETLR